MAHIIYLNRKEILKVKVEFKFLKPGARDFKSLSAYDLELNILEYN